MNELSAFPRHLFGTVHTSMKVVLGGAVLKVTGCYSALINRLLLFIGEISFLWQIKRQNCHVTHSLLVFLGLSCTDLHIHVQCT